MKKCGYVTLFGKPNSGKSTLLNRLLNYNLSIVTRKVQTTRNKISGVLTENNYQIIFLDTPGFLAPKYELQKFMLKELNSSLEDADVILNLIDATAFDMNVQIDIFSKIRKSIGTKAYIPLFTKSDLLEEEKLKNFISLYEKEFPGFEIIPVSALTGKNIDLLKNTIVEKLPESEFLFDEEHLTDKPEKFFVSEIIRKNILEQFREEIPYSVFVNVIEYKEREKGKIYIHAEIIVERESQKIIIIGRKGASLKKIGESSRMEIEKFLGKGIFLKLFVKIRKDWRNNPTFLKSNF
ncbi:MAG: GTPase Era [Ignavibacteria bacterium]|nr:GTPase Era [Ignavibacteria bacterium]